MKRDPVKFPYPSGDGFYSDLQVCRSGAGYYIGRMHWCPEYDGFVEPGSRESDYFPDAESAAKALTTNFEVRECSENEAMYESGVVPRPGAS